MSTFGIPDPGRASSAVEMVVAGASPFDVIRNATLEGREFWSGRDLMGFLDYSQWRDFANAINRARAAAHNSGHDTTQHFASARKNSGQDGGRPAEDFHLSRYACYLVAMNADSSKARVAEAQTYFAIRTRESEVSIASTPPAPSAVMPTHSEALRGWASEIEAREFAEAKVAELAPPAAAWNELAEAAGDYSVADAAKVLSRDPSIATGRDRLFDFMQGAGWIFRGNGRWRAYQKHVDNGRLVEKIGKPFVRDGEVCTPDPTIRITPKGLQELHKRLGGGSQQLMLAVAE